MPADVAPETQRYYQQLTRFSAALAFLADVSMGTLGGALKRKEKLSARLGDILSLLYLCSATLKRYEDEGRQAADAPLMHWAIWDAMFKAQNAFEGRDLELSEPRRSRRCCAAIVFPLGRPYVVPSDTLGHEVAKLLIAPSPTRDRLTAGMFIPRRGRRSGAADRARARRDDRRRADRGEAARCDCAAGKLDAAVTRRARVPSARLARAVAAGIITADEARVLAEHRELVANVIRVDDFGPDLGASLLRPHASATLAEAASASAAVHRAPALTARAARSCSRGERWPPHEPIYIVDGARTPFLKSRNRPGPFAASDLATDAGRALLLAPAVRADASSTR